MKKEALAKMSPDEQLNYFGTLAQQYIFNEKKVEEALQTLKSQDNDFPVDIVQNALTKGEGEYPENYFDLFDVFHEPPFDFLLLQVAKIAITEEPINVKIKGNISGSGFKENRLVIHGDLHIEGNLTLDVGLFVTGNLTVNGVLKDAIEWTPFLVGGNIEAKAIDLGGQVYCANNVKADCICIDGTGKLLAKNGITAKLLIKEGYENEIDGEINAEHIADFKEDYEVTIEKAMHALKKILKNDIYAPLESDWKIRGEDFYFPKRLVMDAIKKGDDILIQ